MIERKINNIMKRNNKWIQMFCVAEQTGMTCQIMEEEGFSIKEIVEVCGSSLPQEQWKPALTPGSPPRCIMVVGCKGHQEQPLVFTPKEFEVPHTMKEHHV